MVKPRINTEDEISALPVPTTVKPREDDELLELDPEELELDEEQSKIVDELPLTLIIAMFLAMRLSSRTASTVNPQSNSPTF